MKASELKEGDVIAGLWTVTKVAQACTFTEDSFQTEEWTRATRQADPYNTIVFVKLERGLPDPVDWNTWFLADEEVRP
jgi:hypothetical protein